MNISKKFEVEADKPDKDKVMVTIKNATKELDGKYVCIVIFTKPDNKTERKEDPKSFYFWDDSIKINISVHDTKDKNKKFDSVKKGDPFIVECGADVKSLKDYKVTLFQGNEPFAMFDVTDVTKS